MGNRNGRTEADQRYRPVNRKLCRYGWIEKTLTEMKEKEGITVFKSVDVCNRIKKTSNNTVAGILRFTNGIKYDNGDYYFTGEEIRVDAG